MKKLFLLLIFQLLRRHLHQITTSRRLLDRGEMSPSDEEKVFA